MKISTPALFQSFRKYSAVSYFGETFPLADNYLYAGEHRHSALCKHSHACHRQARFWKGYRVPRQQRGARIGTGALGSRSFTHAAEIPNERGTGARTGCRDRAALGEGNSGRREDDRGPWASYNPQRTSGSSDSETSASHQNHIVLRGLVASSSDNRRDVTANSTSVINTE